MWFDGLMGYCTIGFFYNCEKNTILEVSIEFNENITLFADTLSLGDRPMSDAAERHPGNSRPRQQLLDSAGTGLKSKMEPSFDFMQQTNVTALVGKTAYLTCKVQNIGDKTVSLTARSSEDPTWSDECNDE